jgi:EpsD family peptidyl-prolyl cis-trans isomerase
MKAVSFLAITCMVVGLQGCSGKAGGQAVVSGADGFEVPLAEFEQARYAAAGGADVAPQSMAMQRVVLDRVVDQELFAREARREKLDRDLNVVQAIEAAKRGILANAYAERLVAALPPPSDAQVSSFYASHPELFADRKILSLNEIAFSGDPALLNELKKQFTATNGSLDALQKSLAQHGVTAAIVSVERAPENLDMTVASQFSRLKVGDSVIYQLPRDTHFAVVTSVQTSPVAFAQAAPEIRNLLLNEARRELIDKDGERLRAEAKLVYAKGYAPVAAAGK